eukprot:1651186-Rhodomonas_salina.1
MYVVWMCGLARVKDLSSFGLQVKNACKVHHSNVFLNNDSTITLHPLREIIVWKLLELSFKASAAGNDWVKLQQAIMVDLTLDCYFLTSYMLLIAGLSNKAVSGSSERNTDTKILGTLIKKPQEADGN